MGVCAQHIADGCFNQQSLPLEGGLRVLAPGEPGLGDRTSLTCPFLRQHFPFFRTAPEGWKNTIRHNLCFRNSFEKVPASTQTARAGSWPRACLWKLTEEGRRRFQEEARALASVHLARIRQCMSQPGAKPPHSVCVGVVCEDLGPRLDVQGRKHTMGSKGRE